MIAGVSLGSGSGVVRRGDRSVLPLVESSVLGFVRDGDLTRGNADSVRAI